MTTESLFNKLLGRAIPKGVKRKMVLVAVFIELERGRGEEHPRLEDLNAQMHLVDDETILHRMADLVGVILRLHSCPVKTSAGILENCASVIHWLPSWLQYGERNEIMSDLAELTVCNIEPRA